MHIGSKICRQHAWTIGYGFAAAHSPWTQAVHSGGQKNENMRVPIHEHGDLVYKGVGTDAWAAHPRQINDETDGITEDYRYVEGE